jgi:hypothetical protein
MNTNHLRHTSMMIAVGFLAAAQAAPLDKPGATVIKDASLAKAFAQATRQFTSQGSGFTAKNPGQPYATTISSTGQLKLKVGESQVGISASAYGFGAQRMPISAPTLSSGKDKDGWPEVQLQRTGLSERYVNGTGGMHHWLSVASRPATANGNLWVNLSVTGAKGFRSLSQTAAEVTIGSTKLKYAGLKVWDAAGRTLPARMETNSTGIGLVVTDANAKYPITIDPVWTSETKLTLPSNATSYNHGYRTAIDGNLAVIAGIGFDSLILVFEKDSDGWNYRQMLSGFGYLNSIQMAGNTLAIGESGVVKVFRWQSGQFILDTTLSQPDIWSFGYYIALDSSHLVVGSPSEGKVYVYSDNDSYGGLQSPVVLTGPQNAYWGECVAIRGDYLAVAMDSATGGDVQVFQYANGSWTYHNTLSSNSGYLHYYPTCLTLTDEDVVLSSYDRTVSFNNYKSGNPSEQDLLGGATAFNGRFLLVGSDNENKARVYEKDLSGGWNCIDEIDHSQLAGSSFGYSVSASENYLLVGAISEDDYVGAAYVYALGAGGSGGTSNPTVTVTFPSLNSYSGTPGIYGSLSGKGLVTLSSAAPNGGTTLDLNSASGHLTVPSTVTVAAGQTTAEFNFTTEHVGSDADVLVQASGAAVTSGTGTVKVLANKVVKIVGATINSLGTGTGTVKLAVPATSDFTVYLSSANPNLVQVPESVVVPAGKTSVTFTVTSASAVADLTDVYISATPANGEKKAKVTIRPEVQVNSVYLNDSVILAGTQTIGTVFLEGPAPAGGQVVALSSNRSVVSVPASVTVPEGMMSADFSIQSTGSAATSATITAKNSNGFKKTATLNLVRPRLASVSLSQSTAKGGSEFPTFTVSLTQAMPFDVTISLSSNQRTVASVPESITILAGQVSASGEVTTFKPGKDKTVVISARYQADSSKQVGLKVTK